MPSFPVAERNVALRYAQLEELVASLFDVHEDRISALTARLKLFRQRDFPPNLKAVSSTRFTYDLDAVIRVLLAFQMLDALVPQEAVPPLIESNWPLIRQSFAISLGMIAAKGTEDANADGERRLMVIQPRNLHIFSLPKTDIASPHSGAAVSMVTAESFQRELRRPQSDDLSPLIVIDMQRLASWMRDALLSARWADLSSFDELQGSGG